MKRFTEGINWYIGQIKEKHLEHRFFDLSLEPFTVLDIMTMGKLASADLNWGVYAKFLKMAESPGWEKAFEVLVKKRQTDSYSAENEASPQLFEMIKNLTKSGSNSLVVHQNRSQTGSALIANDPHVGIFLPNLWLLAGFKSPSYHMVGLMIPGIPFFALGRNTSISWGGTNMRGISSHLFDVSNLDKNRVIKRDEIIKRRWWFDKKVTIRETPFGPIFTDLDYFDRNKQPFTAALYWIGREPSDEIGAFLRANRAKNWKEFVTAFQDYRVSAMNIVYADRLGHIGMIPAYGQPILKNPDQTLKLVKSKDNPIVGIIKPTQLPNAYNPKSGFIASANNKPFQNLSVPFAYGFANNDRYERMTSLIENTDKVGIKELMDLQKDVFSKTAYNLKNTVMNKVKSYGKISSPIWDSFASWQGFYEAKEKGAVAFEILMYFGWRDYITSNHTDLTLQKYYQGFDGWKPIMRHWIEQLQGRLVYAKLQSWIKNSEAYWNNNMVWGDFHRQIIQHPMGSIPFLGRRFKILEYGENGGNDTLFKTGRRFSPEVQKVSYGASARHISDMSHIDENYFVLKGGQDGWMTTKNLSDQIKLWRQGRYIKIPLSLKKIKNEFTANLTVLTPNNTN
ncbi:MAG: penicillin acylase family protein [Pseudobacteriovorax sp.]|nr:penicillin acylase family protein [Pseudobacteriovorax sp.]